MFDDNVFKEVWRREVGVKSSQVDGDGVDGAFHMESVLSLLSQTLLV